MATTDIKITVHWLNGSRAQSTLWLLEELKLPYELQIYHREQLLAPPALAEIHPLGKSPVVTIAMPGGEGKPLVLAESGFIAQYLCDHFAQGTTLVPARWKEGQKGKVGGETEEWMRYQYTLYALEGSLMPHLVRLLMMNALKGSRVPWLIRPVTRLVADRIISGVIFPDIHKNLALLESQLATAPGGGGYLCGPRLTAADILLSYALLASGERLDSVGGWEHGSVRKAFPKLFAYRDRLEAEPGYQKSVEKIKDMEGKFSAAPQ